MKKQIAAAIAAMGVLVLQGGSSLAQQTQTISSTDKQYLSNDAEGSAYEFQLAELGVEKASSSATEQYAMGVLNDHAKFNAQLMQLAHQKGLTLPVEVKAQDRSRIDRLKQLQGTAFDNAFAREMVRINTSDISDSKREAGITQDQDIQAFLGQFAPTDQQHLQGARSLLNGSAAQTGS